MAGRTRRAGGVIPDFAKLKGTLGGSSQQLLSALKLRDETEARIDRVMVYASLRADEDTSIGATQEIDQIATALAVRYGEAVSWIEPELTAIGFETIAKWMDESDELAVYRQAFDNLFRQKKHILSAREEELIAMAGPGPPHALQRIQPADQCRLEISRHQRRTR
ncbi:MAG: hypothetical protein R3E58_21065 [Phycisphaerae bacterium]